MNAEQYLGWTFIPPTLAGFAQHGSDAPLSPNIIGAVWSLPLDVDQPYTNVAIRISARRCIPDDDLSERYFCKANQTWTIAATR